ncbi:putative ubiquitin-conjugating enzyme E2 24 [Silene latifolia]|uniref:putative ubiquitin-conjugating enzyme E2 24 n=1 Tax=Silene latifolia TaxID=37657 RepID=UPI003D784A58
MTMEMFGDSDVETFSETSSDDQDDIFSIYSGHAQSILSCLEDSIGKIDDFLSFERAFMHGDIVCAAGNPIGQMGKILKVDMYVDLDNVFGQVVKDVNSGKLLRMRSILVGDYVIHGPWVGRVEKVVDNVGIVFDDGTKSEIMATDQARLLPLSPNLLDDSLYPYHPGQRVRLDQPSGSKPARWLCGTSKRNQNEGTVFSVDVGIVYVEWISSIFVGVSTTIPPPPYQQDPKDLTLLSCFSHASWHLGDWCILPADASHVNNLESGMLRNLDETFSIMKKKIKVDVMWQDGTCTLGLDPQALLPVSVVNAHDFFPGQFVIEKTNSDELIASNDRKWGIVKSVDANERTVQVKWENMDENASSLNEGTFETVSAYELVEHPDFSYNIGDIVLKSNKNNRIDQLGRKSMSNLTSLANEDYEAHLSVTDKKYFLSCIGTIIGVNSGEIEVHWANGVMTQVAPFMILHMEKDDGSVAIHSHEGDNVTEFSNEVADYERQSVNHQDVSDTSGATVVSCQSSHTSRLSSLSQAAMGFFTSIAANIFSLNGTMSLPQPSSCYHTIDERKIGHFDGQDMLKSCDNTEVDVYETMTYDQKTKERIDNTGPMQASEDRGSGEFRQFDVLVDCSDHHFVDGDSKEATLSQVRRGWLKKVQQEWSILEKDLPESIYVRIYEERMDLIRAAIVGASGTPYHDGLFFFDIFLPPDYPQVPPRVHYHSGGLRLNPNLYESGKVCLSLLNTWNGTGTEVWNPGSSTVLQVLLSLQALVLNEKPYFNEAGYDDQKGRAEGEKNSMSYNENAYLGTCKSMLYQLRKPPKHFEGLVKEHYERRSQYILSACKGYMEGTSFGFGTKTEHVKGNSTGFKIMLAKLYPKLVEAFSENRIDCSEYTQIARNESS